MLDPKKFIYEALHVGTYCLLESSRCEKESNYYMFATVGISCMIYGLVGTAGHMFDKLYECGFTITDD